MPARRQPRALTGAPPQPPPPLRLPPRHAATPRRASAPRRRPSLRPIRYTRSASGGKADWICAGTVRASPICTPPGRRGGVRDGAMSSMRQRRVSVEARPSSLDEQRPPVPRRLSISFPVADAEHQPRGQHDGVGTGGGALLREAYQQFLVRHWPPVLARCQRARPIARTTAPAWRLTTLPAGPTARADATVRSQGTQVLMGAFAPLLYFSLAAARLRLEPWVVAQHLLACALLAFIAASAGAFKLRRVRGRLAPGAACGWALTQVPLRSAFPESCCQRRCT